MSSGYMDCGCPTCFGIAIGESGSPTPVLCLVCEDAGCDGESDCRVVEEDDL